MPHRFAGDQNTVAMVNTVCSIADLHISQQFSTILPKTGRVLGVPKMWSSPALEYSEFQPAEKSKSW